MPAPLIVVDDVPDEPPQPERFLYTVDEAAALLSLSARQVWREIAAGRIAAVHVGRLVRVPRGALTAYICSLEAQA